MERLLTLVDARTRDTAVIAKLDRLTRSATPACPEVPQRSKIIREHIAISSAHLARIDKVLHMFDGIVQSALVIPALRPAILKPGEVLLSMSEMAALVVIHIGIPASLAQIIQSPINRRSAVTVAPISVRSTVAKAILLVVATITVWTVDLRNACNGYQE